MSKDCPVQFNPSVPRAPNCTIRSTDFIPASVPVAAPSVPMAQPVGSRDAMKELSDAFNRVKSLQGDEKVEVGNYLKDLVAHMDF